MVLSADPAKPFSPDNIQGRTLVFVGNGANATYGSRRALVSLISKKIFTKKLFVEAAVACVRY